MPNFCWLSLFLVSNLIFSTGYLLFSRKFVEIDLLTICVPVAFRTFLKS